MELNFRIWNFELAKRQHTKWVQIWILILIQIMDQKHRGNVAIKHLKTKRNNSCQGWYDLYPYYPIDYLIYAEFSSFIVSLYFIAARAKKEISTQWLDLTIFRSFRPESGHFNQKQKILLHFNQVKSNRNEYTVQ